MVVYTEAYPIFRRDRSPTADRNHRKRVRAKVDPARASAPSPKPSGSISRCILEERSAPDWDNWSPFRDQSDRTGPCPLRAVPDTMVARVVPAQDRQH